MREKIELAVTKITQEGRSGSSVDMLKWWTLMASDISSHLLFGESFCTLEHGEINEYIRVLTNALKGNGIGAELPLLRAIGKRLPIQAFKELFRTNELLADHAKIAVRNMKAPQQNKNVFANIAAEAEKGEGLTDQDVEVETIALFVAGTDTTAISLTYLIWAVLSRPELQKNIETEARNLKAEYRDADIERDCPLLNVAIEEAMRLYGAAPGAFPRTVPGGGIRLGDYFLPQDSIVSTHAYSIHRDPSLFPDPLAFRPERRLANSIERVSDAAKAMFTPFGAGSRTCLGLHIAYMDLRLAAVEFFRRCPGSRVAPSTSNASMEFENFFLIAPKAHCCEIVVGST
ncbi:Putative cytochrome P450 [Septoria linicola]|uniref:Cytochrome P450 n=1 Tax=Septoria linicola TaxID=215465 RepID=A0A9Q9AWD8_9PEZI|nr:Putative cytochrome P450 [Septoria linicola]